MSYRLLKSGPAHFALPTVASEIPVLPTVPSNSTDPVLGFNSPCSSASSMTDRGQRYSQGTLSMFSLRKATRSLTDPPGFKNWLEMSFRLYLVTPTNLAFALPYCQFSLCGCCWTRLTRISTPSASLSELIRIRGVLPILRHQPALALAIPCLHPTYQANYAIYYLFTSQLYRAGRYS